MKTPKYNIKEDEKFPWVKVITIETNEPIDLDSEYFNITVKDQLEYFIQDYIKDGDTFELEELFKLDTEPTIEICKYAKQYTYIPCFVCNGTGLIPCSACNGEGIIYYTRRPSVGCTTCGGSGQSDCPGGVTPGSGLMTCTACSGDLTQHTICDNDSIFNENLVSTIDKYNNSSYDNLIENGIQFWLEGDDNKKLIIRIVTKGHSTINPSGYGYWNTDTRQYDYTEYVGFTIANFTITLNKNEGFKTDVFMVPSIRTNDPEKLIPSAEDKVQILPDGYDRVGFDWNGDGKGLNNLYVNNTDPMVTSAYEYTQASAIPNKWYTVGPDNLSAYLTPEYVVKSSAYINEYLKYGLTKDLLTGEMSARNFTMTIANFDSYLYDEYRNTYIELPMDYDEKEGEDTIYVSANNECVSGTLYCSEIVQHIVNSADNPGKIRKNQVKLEFGI